MTEPLFLEISNARRRQAFERLQWQVPVERVHEQSFSLSATRFCPKVRQQTTEADAGKHAPD